MNINVWGLKACEEYHYKRSQIELETYCDLDNEGYIMK
jgi:hypothetical protein